MPGAVVEGYVLGDATVAAHQGVRRCTQLRDRADERVDVRPEGQGRQRAAEQGVDPGAAEAAGRQADPVQHDQIGHHIGRTRILVGAGALPGRRNKPGFSVNLYLRQFNTCSAPMEQR